LTRQQVKEAPDVETDQPVSRQWESDAYEYYGWSPYWGTGSYLGMAGYGGGYVSLRPSPKLMQRERDIDAAQRIKDDPALRSANEVVGYHIQASDGQIGHVEDILVEDEDWSIHYLVADTKNWWPGRKVLISPLTVREIDWSDRQVRLGTDRQKVKDSPAYDPSTTVDPIYENSFRKHYGDLRID
jgi:hypothetical protein